MFSDEFYLAFPEAKHDENQPSDNQPIFRSWIGLDWYEFFPPLIVWIPKALMEDTILMDGDAV